MEEQPHAQPIEQQQNGGRGRPRLLKVEQTEPFVKRPRGRPRIERPLKIPQKRGRKRLIKTEEPPPKKKQVGLGFTLLVLLENLKILTILRHVINIFPNRR